MISNSKKATRTKHDRKSFDYNHNQKHKNATNFPIRPSASHSSSLDLIAQFKKKHYQQTKQQPMRDLGKFNRVVDNKIKDDDDILANIDEEHETNQKTKMSHLSSFNQAQVTPTTRHSSLQVDQHQPQNASTTNNGFLLGTFLKVWTRLKRPILLSGAGARLGGSGNKARLPHSISDQSNGFDYIPGKQMPPMDGDATAQISPKFFNRSQMLKLCDQNFRQSHDQEQGKHLLPIGDLGESGSDKISGVACIGGGCSSNTGSSGISSSSSQHFAPQLHNNDNSTNELTHQPGHGHLASATLTASAEPVASPLTQSPSLENRRLLVGCEDKKVDATTTSGGIAERRISAPPQLDHDASQAVMSDYGFGMIRLHNNHKNSNKTVAHRRQQRALGNTLSEDVAEQMSDDLSGDDIYSTPNDSIVSLQNQPNRRQSMVKSHSTNNFSESIRLNNQNTYQIQFEQRQQPTPLPPRMSTNHNTSNNNKLLNKTTNSSRFFISSSSSDDSTAIPSHEQTTNQNGPAKKIDHKSSYQITSQRLPFRLGVHYHSISPPSSLIRTSPQFLIKTSQQQHQEQQQMQLQSQQWDIIDVLSNQPDKKDSFLPIHEQYPIVVNQTAPMSPMDISSPTRKLSSFLHARKPQLMTSFHKKSPSLHDFQNNNNNIHRDVLQPNRSQLQQQHQTDNSIIKSNYRARHNNNIPNSISLFNCQLRCDDARSAICSNRAEKSLQACSNNNKNVIDSQDAEFKLAQMLLNMNSDLNVKDDHGHTALMYAVSSDNLASIKCLVENGANINETNDLGLSALDILCAKEPSVERLKTLNFLVSNGANCDALNEKDGTRLLDRLIALHGTSQHSNHKLRRLTDSNNKLPYIEFLLKNGAKLGSSTWQAAYGKHDILLKLLGKLCQDGYFLYKNSSIEAAVYRFQYALKRASELNHQLMMGLQSDRFNSHQIHQACQQLQYQTYLGLSRCEFKRKSFDRALEFAQLAILTDSTAYEAYYSKGHILKNMGDLSGALSTINQSLRLVDRSIAKAKTDLDRLYEDQEEAMIIFEANHNNFVELKEDADLFAESKQELESMVDYLAEARRFISNLKAEVVKEQQIDCNTQDISNAVVN